MQQSVHQLKVKIKKKDESFTPRPKSFSSRKKIKAKAKAGMQDEHQDHGLCLSSRTQGQEHLARTTRLAKCTLSFTGSPNCQIVILTLTVI